MITSEQRDELIAACDYFPTIEQIIQLTEDVGYNRVEYLANIWVCIYLLNDDDLDYIVNVGGYRGMFYPLPEVGTLDYEKALIAAKKEVISTTIELIHRLLATAYNKDSLKVLIEFLVLRANLERNNED